MHLLTHRDYAEPMSCCCCGESHHLWCLEVFPSAIACQAAKSKRTFCVFAPDLICCLATQVTLCYC